MLDSIVIHWRVLCILYGSLLASTALAIAHHFYYQNLSGAPVSTANDFAIGSWAGVPSQKFNTAVGNTFASQFRTFLTITATTAYFQILWRALKTESTRLNVVDAISGILANPVGFLNAGAWKKSVILLTLAITIWLLPIASIITPATLTVETTSRITEYSLNVSAVDFNSINFASIIWDSGARCRYYYNGPQFEVQKVVTAATGQGAVLPISAPFDQSNASYTQQFAGPALQCSDVVEPLRGQILSNVNASSWNLTTSFGYLAWVPNEASPLPFESMSGSDGVETRQLRSDTIGPVAGNAPLTLFMGTFPNLIKPWYPGEMITGWNYTANATVIECRLVNATYTASRNWTNGVQDLKLAVALSDNNITYPSDVYCGDYVFKNGLRVTDAQNLTLQPLSDYDNTLIQNFAYAAVMDAFVKVVKGALYNLANSSGLASSTNVMSTPLGSTKELLAVQQLIATGMEDFSSLGSLVWPGVSVKMQVDSPLPLLSTLEQMFQNVTMSLMSSALLQPDPATPYYPQPVNVTTITYHSQYAYSAAMLWLAYGTAILIATITVLLVLWLPHIINLGRISCHVTIFCHINLIQNVDLDVAAELCIILWDDLYGHQLINVSLVDAGFYCPGHELHELATLRMQFNLCPSSE
ncbi:hypothetical protein KCU77_g8066, partial [Aureobasidium melanogenum]